MHTALRVLCIVAILGGLAVAIVRGIQLREWMWDYTLPVRYTNDIGHGLGVGQSVLAEARSQAVARGEGSDPLTPRQILRGFIGTYDQIQKNTPDRNYDLDYPPLRLMVMSCFAWYWDSQGERGGYHEELAQPLRHVNLACEAAAMVPLFFLVWLWTRRHRTSRMLSTNVSMDYAALGGSSSAGARWMPLTGADWPWIAGVIAVLLAWFNLSTMLDAYAWPQWDVWLLPFYLTAMLAASTDWWALAGIAIAAGAMFKGQILFGSGVLLIWPLARGNIGAALRLVVGLLATTAVIVSPWMLPTQLAWVWLSGVAAAALVLTWRGAQSGKQTMAEASLGDGSPSADGRFAWLTVWIVLGAAATLLTALPWLIHFRTPRAWPLGVLAVAMAATLWLVPKFRDRYPGFAPCWAAALIAAAIFFAAQPFGGSWAWWDVGFQYPTRHFQMLHIGPSSNLAALFDDQYHWQLMDRVFTINLPLFGPVNVLLKYLLTMIYGLTLLLCGIGAAMHDRRGSSSTLIALIAPFVLSFAILPQQHERYLLWAAVFSVAVVGISFSLTLLHLLITAISATMIFQWLGDQNPKFSPALIRFVDGTNPGLAWMVLLIAAIYLYRAIVPDRPLPPPRVAV
jgi:hypothetical protein